MTEADPAEPALDPLECNFHVACSEIIAAARRLRPKLAAHNRDAGKEFGKVVSAAMARVGATEDEARHFGRCVLEAVLAEERSSDRIAMGRSDH